MEIRTIQNEYGNGQKELKCQWNKKYLQILNKGRKINCGLLEKMCKTERFLKINYIGERIDGGLLRTF